MALIAQISNTAADNIAPYSVTQDLKLAHAVHSNSGVCSNLFKSYLARVLSLLHTFSLIHRPGQSGGKLEKNYPLDILEYPTFSRIYWISWISSISKVSQDTKTFGCWISWIFGYIETLLYDTQPPWMLDILDIWIYRNFVIWHTAPLDVGYTGFLDI